MSIMNNFPSVYREGQTMPYPELSKCTIDMTVEELCQTFKFSKIITKTI